MARRRIIYGGESIDAVVGVRVRDAEAEKCARDDDWLMAGLCTSATLEWLTETSPACAAAAALDALCPARCSAMEMASDDCDPAVAAVEWGAGL